MTAKTYLALDPDEEILFTARRHWINIFPILLSTVLLLAFVSYALGWLLANTDKIPAGVPATALATILMALAGLSILISIIAFLVYRQNCITLTNKHYLQITQNGLFNRVVSKLRLEEIQDCEGKRQGIFPTLLGYGEILIETAGEEENFDFGPISDALNVAEMINDAHQKYCSHPAQHFPEPSNVSTNTAESVPESSQPAAQEPPVVPPSTTTTT